jgi:hypothetical protein
MHVIITGGTGLIGRSLAASLARDGHRVSVLSRDPRGARPVPGCELVGWDARSAAGWGHLVDGADAVVNLAGESLAGTGPVPARWSASRLALIRDSRLDAARAVVAAVAAAERPPAVLVQASGIGYYGTLGDEPVDESAPPGRDFLARLCVDWEAASEPVEARGVRRCVVRTGVVLSMRGGALPRIVLPYRLFAGGPLGSGRQYLSWIHEDDQVGAIRSLLERPEARGPFNLSAPEPVTNAVFCHALGRVLHRPSLLPVPALALRLLLGEAATLVLEGQRVLPGRLQAMGYRFRFPGVEAALHDLLD